MRAQSTVHVSDKNVTAATNFMMCGSEGKSWMKGKHKKMRACQIDGIRYDTCKIIYKQFHSYIQWLDGQRDCQH